MSNYVGLDIETTGLEPSENHRLIQFGIYFQRDGDTLVRDILPMGTMVLDPEAMKVNGFSLARIQAGSPNDEADEEIVQWLEAKGIEPDSLTAVGFNVGWFDQHGFIKKELPKTAKFFGRRSVDLTGITYLFSEIESKPREQVKNEIRDTVAKRLVGKAMWHDAGYDARAAIETFVVMQEMLKEIKLAV